MAMKLVQLTDLAGNPLYLNPANIASVRTPAPGESDPAAKTGIVLSSGGTIWVSKDPKAVAEAIEAAGSRLTLLSAFVVSLPSRVSTPPPTLGRRFAV
jgi:hypothetical protein